VSVLPISADDLAMELPNLDKPNILRHVLGLSRLCIRNKVKVPNYLRDGFGKLHQADVLAQTGARALTELSK
jgi:hypothetical protein